MPTNIAFEAHKITVTLADGTQQVFLDAATVSQVTDEKVTITKSDGTTEEFDKVAA